MIGRILLLTLLGVLVVVYWQYYPGEDSFFPKCPFKLLTSIECPGCGSQRAIHHLLNFEINQAWNSNQLVVLFLPYLVFGTLYGKILKREDWIASIRENLYGKKAAIGILILVLLFWFYRISHIVFT